jgi:hypothetical protein
MTILGNIVLMIVFIKFYFISIAVVCNNFAIFYYEHINKEMSVDWFIDAVSFSFTILYFIFVICLHNECNK